MRDQTTRDLGDDSTKPYDGDDGRRGNLGRTESSDSLEQDRFLDDDMPAKAVDRPLSNDPFGGDDRLGDETSGGVDRLGDDGFARESPLGTSDRPGIVREDHAPLFSLDDSDRFRARWKDIQTNFVDEPRRSVEEADELVAEVTEQLTSAFTRNRDELERQWTAGDEVSTENLRQTLKQYRGFFERLLSM